MIRNTTPQDDNGVGLIEIIVAIVVSGILLTAIATIFINSWKTQEGVTSASAATNRGQIVGSMIERAVRNAEFIQDPIGGVLLVRTSLVNGIPDDEAALLHTSDTDPDDTRRCQGFTVVEDQASGPEHELKLPDGTKEKKKVLRYIASSSTLPADTDDWATGQPHLHVEAGLISGSAASGVTYDFTFETESAPVRIAGAVAARSTQDTAKGADQCW